MINLSVLNATVPQLNPTPKPQQTKEVGLFSHFPFNSATMVIGMLAPLVLPNIYMLDGAGSIIILFEEAADRIGRHEFCCKKIMAA